MNSHELREAAFEADMASKSAFILKEAGCRGGYGKYGNRVLMPLIERLYEGSEMDTPAGVILRNHIKRAMADIADDSLSRLEKKGISYTPDNPLESLRYGYEDESVVDDEVPQRYRKNASPHTPSLQNKIYAAQDERKERRKSNLPHSDEPSPITRE